LPVFGWEKVDLKPSTSRKRLVAQKPKHRVISYEEAMALQTGKGKPGEREMTPKEARYYKKIRW